jgi:spermidine synthase
VKPSDQRVHILPAMFCLGIFSVLAQVTFVREMLVAFFGNELSIGAILSCWLLGISLGAFSARFVGRRVRHSRHTRWLLAFLLVVVAVMLPAQMLAVRVIRAALGVPMGEYASFGAIALSAFAIFLPTCFSIGLFFPFACEVLAASGRRSPASAVSRIYAFEAAGSMLGGAALSYLLLPVLTPYRVALLAGAIAFGATATVAPRRAARLLAALLGAGLVTLSVLYPGFVRSAEAWTIETRWRAFGVLRPHGDTGPRVRLVASDNTIYQNLAVTESEGQYALYGNGQVMFVFPDKYGYEHVVHFAMAQKPDARRVLLIGGNPVGDIPELLKYPLERLVHVDLDPGVAAIVTRVVPDQVAPLRKDPRLTMVTQDAPRYVAGCAETFDVILIHAPEPTTTAANRFYTREFYGNVRRILAPRGFAYTAVTSAVRLQSAATDLGGTVYKTLKQVFPVVLVTAEARNRFFAGSQSSGLTFDRRTLTERSAGADIRTEFFQPKYYFRGADEITPEKTDYVADRFSSAAGPLNTSLQPVTYFYSLLLWSRFSGSAVEKLLTAMRGTNYRTPAIGLIGLGIVCLFVGATVAMTRHGKGQAGNGWSRLMAGTLIGTTGFCAMALEILLIFVFQALYGYVYTRIGLIVAMFMLGLVLGAPSGRFLAGGGRRRCWISLASLELLLLLFALGVPRLAAAGALPGGTRWIEPAIYIAVALAGWTVGAEFPLGNRLFCDAGGTVRTAAAITDGSDHVGAAIGAAVVGVILVPVFGISASCVVLAALKCAGLFLLAAAVVPLVKGGE